MMTRVGWSGRCVVIAMGCVLLAGGVAIAQGPQMEDAAGRARVDALLQKMTTEEKIDYIGGTGFGLRPVPRLGLPALEMSDGPYGTRSNAGLPSTTYSAGIGLAATWNRALAEQVGEGIGRDARARGVHFMLGPGVNIYRSPRNGRNFEYFGEDPYLAGAIAVGYIRGMQSQGVSATVKHFLGNNSEFLRHDSETLIEERALREIYLPAFEASVKMGHVGAMMDSYNLINGAHATQNGRFNTELVRKEWGFPGVMMSDWLATYDAVAAANGGLDVEMPSGKFMNRANLMPAIQSGTVTMATIDEKVRHVLETADRFGWLDRKEPYKQGPLYDLKNNAVALASAREGLVLLKNEGKVLPLDKAQVKSILVVGPDAFPGVPVGGGSAGVTPFHVVSAVEGVGKMVAPGTQVYYERGLLPLRTMAQATAFVTEAKGGKPGLMLETFKNMEMSGTPAETAVVPHIDVKGVTFAVLLEDPSVVAEVFASTEKHEQSRRWSGYYIVEKAGPHIVALQGAMEGTGNRVSVDGKVVIDNWSITRAMLSQVTMQLAAGPHKVVVEDKQSSLLGGEEHLVIADAREVVSQYVKDLAAKVDAVVVVAGFDWNSEGEGSDRTFALPLGQDELIEAMAAANRKTVVAVTSGGNVESSRWIGKVPAYMETWYAGQEGGTALAEVLFGAVNPSGHLPATFERKAEDNPTFKTYYPEGDSIQVKYKEGIFVGYRGYEHNKVKPLFPFGFGLSYTTFKFAGLNVTKDGKDVTVQFDVTNTGDRAGAEVAQVYVADEHAKIARPVKELKGFEKVMLQPGETKHVRVSLDGRAFAYYDVAGKQWRIDGGRFEVRVGDSVESTPLVGSVVVEGGVVE